MPAASRQCDACRTRPGGFLGDHADTARRLARALPDARLQLVEGAGHHLSRRAPDAVAAAIVAFLAAVERSGSPAAAGQAADQP
jgi:hypothetical protein